MDYSNRNLHLKEELPDFLVDKHFLATVVMVDQQDDTVLKAGTIYPSNDENAIGIVLKDYDLSNSDRAVSIIRHGIVREESLPETATTNAKNALNLIIFD